MIPLGYLRILVYLSSTFLLRSRFSGSYSYTNSGHAKSPFIREAEAITTGVSQNLRQAIQHGNKSN